MAQDIMRDTINHIEKVRGYLHLCVDYLIIRAANHDASKLQEPELSGYAGLSEAVAGLQYGTPEYKAAFEPFRDIIQHHYRSNSHHPEHYPGGVDDMTLLDILEMFCDWRAASERGNSDFGSSIKASCQRFGIDRQLGVILANTAQDLGWIEHR